MLRHVLKHNSTHTLTPLKMTDAGGQTPPSRTRTSGYAETHSPRKNKRVCETPLPAQEQTDAPKPTPRAVILSGETIWDALWFRVASPTKLNVVYSLALFGSKSKPVGRLEESDLAGRLTNALNYVKFKLLLLLQNHNRSKALEN